MGTKRTAEITGAIDGAATGVMTGLMAETRIATAMGWRKVEAICEGDKVLTFDNGLQEVSKVTRVRLWDGDGDCPRRFWPIAVPAGVFGNRAAMKILPSQALILESDIAEALYGDAFALVRACVLEGTRGMHRTPPARDAEVVLLHFADEQVVFGEDGALFFCPSSRDLIERALEGHEATYSILPMHEALRLVEQMEAQNECACPAAPADMTQAVAA